MVTLIGVEVQYSLDYNGQSEFTISTLTDMDASSYDAVQLEGFTGTYATCAEHAQIAALQAQVASLSQSLEEEKSERQAEVARLLSADYKTIHSKIKKLGIDRSGG